MPEFAEGLSGVQVLNQIKVSEERIQEIDAELQRLGEERRLSMVRGDYTDSIDTRLDALKKERAFHQERKALLEERLKFFEAKKLRIKEIQKEVVSVNDEAKKVWENIDKAKHEVAKALESLQNLRIKFNQLQGEYSFLSLDPHHGEWPKIRFYPLEAPTEIKKFTEHRG